MDKQITRCPKCGKRACDIKVENETNNLNFYVELKCPNCKNIVKIEYSHYISAATD